eukprot:scaffold395269_cov34-Prasinocladus_malaysianus.AAC.1
MRLIQPSALALYRAVCCRMHLLPQIVARDGPHLLFTLLAYMRQEDIVSFRLLNLRSFVISEQTASQ